MAMLGAMGIVLPVVNPLKIVQVEAVGLEQQAQLARLLLQVSEETEFIRLQYPLLHTRLQESLVWPIQTQHG